MRLPGYDAWKLASPPEYEESGSDLCELCDHYLDEHGEHGCLVRRENFFESDCNCDVKWIEPDEEDEEDDVDELPF